MRKIKCGASEVVITPRLGIGIPGYYEERLANDKIDDLYVKTVVFDDGEILTGVAVADMSHIYMNLVHKARERVRALTGRDASGIIIAATHTHTGGNSDTGEYEASAASESDVEDIVNKIADSIVYAIKREKEFKIGFAKTEEHEVSFNRRWWMKDGVVHTWPGINNPDNIRPASGIDPEVDVIRIDDLSGNPIAVLTNFANHPDTSGGGCAFCADYPGELDRRLKKTLGQNVVSVFMNGCCGDITHVDYSGKFPLVPNQQNIIGAKLAADVLSVYGDIKCEEVHELGVKTKTITIERRQFTKEQYEEAKKKIEEGEKLLNSSREKIDQSDDEFEKPTTGDMLIMELTYCYDAVKLYEHPILSEQAEMQVIKIGDIMINSMPGEMFNELGLDLKARSASDKNIIVTLANGYYGYIATEKAYSEGGYEVTLDHFNNLVPGAGETIVNVILDLQKEL